MQAPLCPYCNQRAALRDSRVVYGRHYGMVWICPSYPQCDSYVGCHPNSKIPLGRLANKELREAKIAAHKAFDRLWRAKMKRDNVGKQKARSLAYRWLAESLGVKPENCHIGMFDVTQCQLVISLCAPYDRMAT